jgi:hypothetical protein
MTNRLSRRQLEKGVMGMLDGRVALVTTLLLRAGESTEVEVAISRYFLVVPAEAGTQPSATL